MRGGQLSAHEIEEIRRRQASQDRNVKPRLGPKISQADVEQIRQQLLAWWRSEIA